MFCHIVILHRHVSATTVTVIKVPYNKHIIDIQPVVQKCMIKPLIVTFNFVYALHMVVEYQITLFLK